MITVGLGDGPNDAAFLNLVDFAVLIRSPLLDGLVAQVPRGIATEFPGLRGWNEAILKIAGRAAGDCSKGKSSLP